jgi:DNA repair protein RecN (Recombination protein N)
MLSHLTIRNFAIITDCELEFHNGMTVLTGETGAGKSIIIDAISLLLGKQASEEWIKTNADSAYLEAIFDLSLSPQHPQLASFLDGDTQLIVSRKLTRGKSSITKVNNQSIPLKQCRELLTPLIAIIGQHEHMRLIDADHQLTLLDSFGGEHFQELQDQYKTVYSEYQRLNTLIQQQHQDKGDTAQRIEFLDFQIKDLEQHNFIPNEDITLEDQRKKAKNVEKLSASYSALAEHLTAISTSAQESERLVGSLSDSDSELSAWQPQLSEISVETQEKLRDIQTKQHQLSEYEALDIDDVESRLDTIFRYKQKYHATSTEQLVDILNTLSKEKTELHSLTHDSAELESCFSQAKKEAIAVAQDLHDARLVLSDRLSQEVKEKMTHLHFQHAEFKIKVEKDEDNLTSTGFDTITFTVSTNLGEPLKPIQKVASGGELSRIMLAMRVVFSRIQSASTLIFDEVDTGIGGLTANTVGEYLHDISTSAQVLCVTHLPQVARCTDHHYVVHKEMENNATTTQVSVLNKAEKEAELKRMLGGEAVINSIQH